MTYDVLIVGAGPVGLSASLHARRRGLRALVIDKGVVTNHLLEFPIGMAFFTPRHSLELLGIPLDCPREHATREEILSYYGRLSRLAELEIHHDRCLETIRGADGAFTAVTRTRDGKTIEYSARKIVLATGVFGKPRRLPDIPGSTLPKVTYLYREPYSFIGKDVLLVGAGNSSAGAALALHQCGARVTVLDRNASIPRTKWRWHLQDLRQLVATEQIRLLHDAVLESVEPDSVRIRIAGETTQLPNDAVIALLGYEPDSALLEALGVAVDPSTKIPRFNPLTLETETPGLYLAGIVCAGSSPDKIFVWGARHHPKAIFAHIAGEPVLEPLRDLDVHTVAHWAQFEKFDDDLDRDLALQMVPVVTGEIADDFFDIYEWATRTTNLYAERTEDAEQDTSVGPLLESLEGWLFQRNADGSVVYKGQRFSANAFEVLRLCDGTRRMSKIVEVLAAEYEQPEDDIANVVLTLLLPLLRTGKLTWRVTPTGPQRAA